MDVSAAEAAAASATVDRNRGELFAAAFCSDVAIMAFTSLEDGCFIEASAGFLKLLGIQRDEVIGKTPESLGLFADRERFHAIESNVRTQGRAFEADVTLVDRERGQHHVELAAEVVDAGGSPCMLMTVGDITTHRMIEESQWDAERDCRALIENMQSAVALYEAVDGGADFRLVEFNAAAERTDDLTREAVVGRLVTEAFPAVEEFGLLDVLRRVSETGRPEHHPARVYRDDRISGWRENHVYRLPSGAVAAVYDDVTSRKQLERALEVERSQLLSMFDSMDEVVYVADPATHEILYANDATRKRYRASAGRKCHEALQGQDEPCSYCTNEHILGGNIGQTYTWEHQNESTSRWYRCIDRAIRWPDGRMVRFEIAIDITDQRTAEEELKRQLEMTSESNRMLELLMSNSGEREHRMIQLKDEVNELLESSGRPPKYSAPKEVRESDLDGALLPPETEED